MVRAIRDTIVLCPPLIIRREEIDHILGTIRRSLDEAEAQLVTL
jgi:putrescine aminotransferase